jgi:hypothetical protein
MARLSLGADDKAARLANCLICTGHTRRAARALHSTATMADLTQPAVREAVQLLHPPLPVRLARSCVGCPADADQVILEDREDTSRIIRSSDNGAAAGPSGWGGGLLAALVESDTCRLGIVALLKDILDGNIPDAARQYLLASRLVAITKPDSDGMRPIAVGELFHGGHCCQRYEQLPLDCCLHTSTGRRAEWRGAHCPTCSSRSQIALSSGLH